MTTVVGAAPATSEAPARTARASRVLELLREHWSIPVVAVISVWITLRHPMSFDGSMNLQVSQSLEAGRGYARHFDGTEYFPIEIQTNGPILFLGAAFIWLFGQHNFVYQLPNVLCMIALFAVAAAVVKGPYRNVLLVAVFLGLPELMQFGYNGYGELPLALIELAAIVLAAKAVARHSQRLFEAAAFLAGIGVVTKVVGVAVLIPLSIAARFFLKEEAQRGKSLTRLIGALALGPILFEIYRFVVLGSWGTWAAWWGDLLDSVRFQSGVSNTEELPIQHSIWQRLGTLASAFESGRMTVAILLMVGVAALAWGAWRLRKAVEDRETFVLRLGLAVMITAYLLWWFFVTPDQKAWLRRIIIALLFLMIGLAHLVAHGAAEAKRDRFQMRPELLGCALALALLVAGPAAHNARLIVKNDDTELRVANAAADFVRAAPPDARFFGLGWWSAPVISAYSERDFLDLSIFDTCTLRPEGDYLVLDRYATLIAFREPPLDQFRVTGVEVTTFSKDTSIWHIAPPADCPAG